MNPEAQKVLDAILHKDLHELTEPDRRFLHARWSYLTEEQQDKYKDAWFITTTKEVVNPLAKYTYIELKQMCKSLGISAPPGLKRPELEDLIINDKSYLQ